MKQSMIDKKIDEKAAIELKTIYYHYLDKRSDIMKNTQFRVNVFGDILILFCKRFSFVRANNKIEKTFSQIDVNINFSININTFKPRKKVYKF